MNSIVNHNMMRSSNLISVFNCIRQNGPVTKKQILKQTGLSWGSISTLTTQLLDLGIIQEKDIKVSSLGRTPIGLDIDSDVNLIIGLDINLLGLTTVIIDLKGRTKYSLQESIKGTQQSVLTLQSENIIQKLLDQMPLKERREVKGIGISFPGHVNPTDGVIVKIHHFSGFQDFPLAKHFKEKFGLDVIVEHDPNCIAIAELIQGAAQKIDSFILIRLCMGIGMGIVTEREIFRGFVGATGEMGHMIINPGGELCECGNHGCLETFSSASTLLHKAREAHNLGLVPHLTSQLNEGKELSLDLMAEAAIGGDTYLESLFTRAGSYAGIALANVVNILDPVTVFISGSLSAYESLVINPLKKVAKNTIWRDGDLDIRTIDNHCFSAAIGAASLFIERILLNTIEKEL